MQIDFNLIDGVCKMLEMEANTSPVMRVAIAFAIAVIALGIALAFSTPFINAIRWW